MASSCALSEGPTTRHFDGSTSWGAVLPARTYSARICCGTGSSVRRLIFAALRTTSQDSKPLGIGLSLTLSQFSFNKVPHKVVTCIFRLNLNASAHRDDRLHNHPPQESTVDCRLTDFQVQSFCAFGIFGMSFARTGTGTLLGGRFSCYTFFGREGISLTRPDMWSATVRSFCQ